ncbi:hypothetical protein D3C81_1332750 [compost metagenome]
MEREKKLKEFKESQAKRYSPKKINEIVSELLGDKDKINASDIEISSIDDYIRLIYVRLYSNNYFTTYKIKRKNNIVEKNGYTYRDFEIWRRKK